MLKCVFTFLADPVYMGCTVSVACSGWASEVGAWIEKGDGNILTWGAKFITSEILISLAFVTFFASVYLLRRDFGHPSPAETDCKLPVTSMCHWLVSATGCQCYEWTWQLCLSALSVCRSFSWLFGL
jgi:hypothetical protein